MDPLPAREPTVPRIVAMATLPPTPPYKGTQLFVASERAVYQLVNMQLIPIPFLDVSAPNFKVPL